MQVLSINKTFSADIIFTDMFHPIKLYPFGSNIPKIITELFTDGTIPPSEVDTVRSITIDCLENK